MHDGYPSGSMVDFACDIDGSPILAVSSLAVHTKVCPVIYTSYLAHIYAFGSYKVILDDKVFLAAVMKILFHKSREIKGS